MRSPPSNHFLDARYGIAGAGLEILARRLFSFASISRIVTITSATAFLCLLSPAWTAVAAPGILFNLMAVPGTGQAGLIGHYLWPILPWLFVAAVFGARRLPSATAKWMPIVIIAVALIDAPLPRSLARAPWSRGPEATQVADQLRAVPATAAVVAQPNLIPHMPRRMNIYGLSVYSAGQPPGDYVLLTTVGDL